MGDTGGSKNRTIKNIFETMDYGNDTETTTEVTEWLKTKGNRLFAHIDKKDEPPNGEILSITNVNNGEAVCDIYVPDEAAIDSILKKFGDAKNTWNDVAPVKRAEIIYKLGTEIQKKQNLLVQLEVAVRGILSKDSKNKGIPLLTDCLQYYSSFSVKYTCENSSWKPEGLVVGLLSDENSLAAFGYVLGPSLALGYNVVLQSGPQLSLIAALLVDLAVAAGVPEGTIRLIPGKVERSIFLTHPKVSILSIFDDLYKEEYLIVNHSSKKLLHFYSSGVPMIVFDNCDLDSACHSVVDAVWGYSGMLPWSVRNIFIQETVFENFVEKLKYRVGQIKVGKSDQKNVDASYPHSNVLDKLAKIVEAAKNEGVEVFQPNPDSVVPTLLIGGNIFNNNVIKEDFVNVPIVTLTAFRTINEAVALSNNTRQGLGTSVWTESTSLTNEVIGKLKVGNVWMNSHGLFAADVSTSPYKCSGNGYFGGSEGFYEYVISKNLNNIETISQIRNPEAMEKAISEAKKGQDAWFKLNRFDRVKNLQIAAQNINANKSTWSLAETWWDNWVTLIHDYVVSSFGDNVVKSRGFNVVSIREPCGIVAVETLEDKETHNKKLIIAALVEGNSVIILNDSKETTSFYSSLSGLLPKGVLTVLPLSQDATKVAALHKELDVYVGEKVNKVFSSLPLKASSKFKVASQKDWRDVRNKVTLVKNVWFNKGQSFL